MDIILCPNHNDRDEPEINIRLSQHGEYYPEYPSHLSPSAPNKCARNARKIKHSEPQPLTRKTDYN
jgi:hypothetical protein